MEASVLNHASVIAVQAVSLVALIAPVGGELYSSFDFAVVSDETSNMLVVTNNGPFQVTGVLLTGTVPGALQPGGTGGCAEGYAIIVENGSIYSKFERMTPNMPCQLANIVDDDIDLSGIVITADGFTDTWTIERAELLPKVWALLWSWWGATFLAMVVAQIYMLYVVYNTSTRLVGYVMKLYWSRSEKRPRMPCATNIMIKYAQEEYGVGISRDEGAILVLLVCGKDTLEQLERYTGMRRIHIRHSIKRLRRHHLVDSINIAPIPSLALSLNAGDLCNDVHPNVENVGRTRIEAERGRRGQ